MEMRFGELIGGARKTKKLTLRRLAQIVGLTPSVLSEMEHSRRLPPKDESKIGNLALVLGLEEKQLIGLARLERQGNKAKLIDRLFGINQEAALGLCRAQEESSDEEFVQALRRALELLGKKG